MDFGVWLALVGLFFAGGLTPGPAVMLVMSSSLRYGARLALVPALGVSAANLVWIALASTGVAVVAASNPGVLAGLKAAGLVFIAWLAWSMVSNDPGEPRARSDQAPKRASLLARGVGLQLLNPNALVFFGLLLPAYFDASRPILVQAATIMATVTATEMVGLAAYAFAASAINVKFQSAAFTRNFNRIAAALMLGSAVFAVMATR